MLGILLGLVFVEKRDHLAHHGVDRFILITDRLSDRDDSDVMLCELPEIELLLEGLAKKAAVAMHDDHVERALAVAGPLDHLLENGSAVITAGRASFDELCDDSIALTCDTRISTAGTGRESKDHAPAWRPV